MENTIATTGSKQPAHLGSFTYPIDSSPAAKRAYRNRSIGNLLRMGHCAPTVMQTVLDSAHIEQEWLVKLTAGMPGGIANTGFECGGVTSPLVLLGLRYGLDHAVQGLPLIFYKGCDLCNRFSNCHKTLMCGEIRGKDRLPLRCIPVIRHSPELLVEATASDSTGAIPEVKREAYGRLYAHLAEKRFHCSQQVLKNLDGMLPVSQELLDATSGFLGGTLFQGRTCSAFTAGSLFHKYFRSNAAAPHNSTMRQKGRRLHNFEVKTTSLCRLHLQASTSLQCFGASARRFWSFNEGGTRTSVLMKQAGRCNGGWLEDRRDRKQPPAGDTNDRHDGLRRECLG